jgi:hypothetical protein
MNNKKHILAIDLGTSGPKAALVTVRGEVVDCMMSGARGTWWLPGGRGGARLS